MAIVMVRVREDFRWSKARVGGREFSKRGEMMNEAALTEEMRRSPLLEIVEAEEQGSGGAVVKRAKGKAKAKAGG